MIKISNEKFDLNILNLTSDTVFFIENSAKEITIEIYGEYTKIENYLKMKVNVTDSILRATHIVTFGKNDVNQLLKKTLELYNFLVENDNMEFRNVFPSEVVVLNIEKMY